MQKLAWVIGARQAPESVIADPVWNAPKRLTCIHVLVIAIAIAVVAALPRLLLSSLLTLLTLLPILTVWRVRHSAPRRHSRQIGVVKLAIVVAKPTLASFGPQETIRLIGLAVNTLTILRWRRSRRWRRRRLRTRDNSCCDCRRPNTSCVHLADALDRVSLRRTHFAVQVCQLFLFGICDFI